MELVPISFARVTEVLDEPSISGPVALPVVFVAGDRVSGLAAPCKDWMLAGLISPLDPEKRTVDNLSN